jgi:MFS family permease
MMQDNKTAALSAWAPLSEPLFRALWIAAVISNIGSLLQSVGAAWMMTSLTSSPLMVSLVQTAATLPIFLLVLPAGALADVVDRRRLLLYTEWWMLVAAAALGVLTLMGVATAWVLLALTFMLGLGFALNLPAWQAVIPELVPRPELPSAVALNSVGFNIARAVGPALGGLVVAQAGAGAAFLLNAASFLGVIAVLYYWRRPTRESLLPAERMMRAIRAGLRYVRHTPILRMVLLRTGVFTLFAAGLLALLPLVARDELGLDSAGYGLLLGAFGLGAVLGVLILSKARQRIHRDVLVHGTTLLFAAAMIVTGYVRFFSAACGAMVAAGVAWLMLLSIFNTAIQMAVPSWVRGRVLACYLLVFFAGLAGGGMLCGTAAEWIGIPATLLCAALCMIGGSFLFARSHLAVDEGQDMTPSLHWLAPMTVIEPDPEQGPALVTIEYRIDAKQSSNFIEAMRDMGRIRRRDGAISWYLLSDLADPGRYVETFFVESWAEHLRQHERMTNADRAVEDRIRAFHIEDRPPVVSHLISAYNASAEHRWGF